MKPRLTATIALLSLSISTQAGMETITVTAQRTANDQSPTSISVIDDIENAQPMHIHELLNQSPGTWISKGNGQEHLTAIRSPIMSGSGGCGPFLMSEDNISLRAPAFCNVNQLFDTNFEQAQRIEVLRGPGTVFHGSNAMHGVINIISPDFADRSTTRLAGEYENTHNYGRVLFDHRNRDGIVQGHFTRDNGYKDDSGFSQQKLRFKHRQQTDEWTLVHNFNASHLEQDTAGFVVGEDAYKDKSNRRANENPEAFRNARSLRWHSDISRETDGDGYFLVTPYLRSNDMEFLMHFQTGTPIEKSGHDSIGVQTAWFRPTSEKTDLVSGFDFDLSYGYLHQFQDQPPPFNPGAFPQGDHYRFNAEVSTAAMFLQAVTALHERLDISYGARIEYARYRYNNKLRDDNPCANSASCRYSAPDDTTETFFNWSPKFAIEWNWLGRQHAFINLSRAFRAPHVYELFRLEEQQTVADIDSEKIRSVELGFKGLIPGNTWYELSFYRMKKDNVIIKNSARQSVDNMKTEHQGAELMLGVDINRYLNIQTAMSYGKHRYARDNDLLFSATDEIKGNIIDSAPRHMHNLTVNIIPTDHSRLALEAVYMGRYYLDEVNEKSYPGHTLYNIRYKQTLPDGWEAGVAVHNIRDTLYADRAGLVPAGLDAGTPRYFIGEPRSLRLSIARNF